MPGVLPASLNAGVVLLCILGLFRLLPNHRDVAPDRQAVEREPELFLPRTPPRFLSPRRSIGAQKQSTLTRTKVTYDANSLLYYPSTPTLQPITPAPASQEQ